MKSYVVVYGIRGKYERSNEIKNIMVRVVRAVDPGLIEAQIESEAIDQNYKLIVLIIKPLIDLVAEGLD